MRSPAPAVRRPIASSRRDAWLPRLLALLFLLSNGLASPGHAVVPVVAAAADPFENALPIDSLPTSAIARTVFEDDAPQLQARLLVTPGREADGAGRRVGVLFDLAEGWHVYWRNPGGTGIAPDLAFGAPHYQIGELAWPAPQTFEEADGLFTTWGYEGSVLLSAPLAPESRPAAPAEQAESERVTHVRDDETLTLDARVLICRTQCVPAEFSLSSPLDPTLSQPDRRRVDRAFAESLARVPLEADDAGLRATAYWKAGRPAADEAGLLELTLETCTGYGGACPQLAEPDARATSGGALFVPIENEIFEYTKATVVSQDPGPGHFVLGLELTRLEATDEDRLRGLVPLRDASGRLRHVELDVPIHADRTERTATTPVAGAGGSGARWIQIFLLALVGGLILNGMPCVLPVLAIKVVAVADMAEKDPRDVRLHGLAYTAGVLGSMALLAAVVLALRSAGHSVGWGFQFQEPLFVAVISAVLVTFALNLFGVFEIELGQGRLATVGQEATGYRRSVFEGLLAVVLATPCSAPFLGTAVGFAFASDGLAIAAIFLAIGLGLASPFLLVSFFPSCARFIPRSGPWMNTLRAGLGFSLLATVVWLLWVMGQSGGADAVVSMSGVLLFLSFLLWGFGQLQPIRSLWLARASALGIAALAFAGFNLIEFDPASPQDTSNGAAATLEAGWQTYSPGAVEASLAEGRPVFVVFTADWCITCKVNERTVLDRESVRRAFDERDFALFKADWTRRDESIRRKLAEFGRAGVPLYLVYDPTTPQAPTVLSELLSQNEVLTALAAASGNRRTKTERSEATRI